MDGNQTKELSALKDLIETFLAHTEKWLQDGIIDKDTYEEIRKEKIIFTVLGKN
ncbi:hypothetical protein NSA47_07740 [Irregularibacter muris]|uniref:Uncharacterized protein n=1 Tax=Irregularibacter muris TaxID=1796619 RepID=A0AAE3L2M8_9FIRM|nr:hypothetical protein [Irregularibacter muris]MCR1898874.1 hypothetical protein [Irregularibacter muris]